jgi:very-long-chain (3R)-3-hydroxyacyl-CoA dehydratase
MLGLPPTRQYNLVTPSETAVFVKYYLITYNILSTLGWTYVLLLALVHVFNLDGNASTTPTQTASSTLSRFFSAIPFVKSSGYVSASIIESRLPPYLQPVYRRATTTFTRVGARTAFVQSFAILEVLHALSGWVKSPLQITAMQVSTRLFLVWGIVEQFDVVSQVSIIPQIIIKQCSRPTQIPSTHR